MGKLAREILRRHAAANGGCFLPGQIRWLEAAMEEYRHANIEEELAKLKEPKESVKFLHSKGLKSWRQLTIETRPAQPVIFIAALLDEYYKCRVEKKLEELGTKEAPWNQYILEQMYGEWYITHKEVGSGEPLKQFLLNEK